MEIKVLTAYNTEEVIKFISLFSHKFNSEEMIKHWIKQMSSGVGYAYGAYDKEVMVGSMGGRMVSPFGTIDYMFIHPEYRNKGVGNMLLTTIENYLFICGISKILTSNEQELSVFLLGNGYLQLEDGTKIKELQNV